MKIAVCQERIEEWEKTFLKSKLKGHKLVFLDEEVTEKNASRIKDVDVLAIFVYSNITKKVLDKLKKLKFVATMSTGYDHIDLSACKKRKIIVSNVPTYGENTVAEHTMALLLAVSRRIVEGVERTRKGVFDSEGLRGFDIKGKTIGIVGTGNIGSHVCKYARAFDMNVLAHDKYPNKDMAKEIGFEYVSRDALLKKSDVVSLHVPLLPATKHMIDANAIKKMKKGVILINTARGSLIETGAVLRGLESEKIAWYAADVLEEECGLRDELEVLHPQYKKKCDIRKILQDHLLMRSERVLITPHNAFNSVEALKRILSTTVENIQGFAKGKPVNVVK